MKQHRLIAVLALVTVIINIYLVKKFPLQRTWGDEAKYTEIAHRDVSFPAKLARLVPGNMYFEWWPSFAYSVYGLFANDNLTRAYHKKNPTIHMNPNLKWNNDFGKFFHSASLFNLVLLLIIGVNIYILCLLLNFGKVAALVASGVFFFNPRILFYVQAVWPELLHLAMFTSALLLLILFYLREKWPFLIMSGILFGFCSLTKGIAGFYLILLLPVFFYFLYAHSKKTVKSSLKIAVLFYCCYLGVVLPQKLANYIDHDVFSVSLNKWVNIECGIIPAEEAGGELYKRYFNASEDPVIREKLSKERVFDYLKRSNIPGLFVKQFRQFVSMQLNRSFLLKGFRLKRWVGTDRASSKKILSGVSVIFSWVLLLFGITGLILYNYKSFGSAIISLFIIYYLSSLFILGFNPRFFVQVLPFLGIFTASCIHFTSRFRKNKLPLSR